MPSTQTTTNFKGFDDYIEVFKAGTHTDASGKVASFTEQDLDQVIQNFDPHHPAPAVLGHPKDNDPAYAWTESIKRDGDKLLVKFNQVDPQFAQGVESGRYRNRSVRLVKSDKGWQLGHVGFLGAVPPAVSGLKPIEFSQFANGEAFDFALTDYQTASALESVKSIFRSLRDWLIGEKGLAQADTILPNYQIESINEMVSSLRSQPVQASPLHYSQTDQKPSDSSPKKEIDMSELINSPATPTTPTTPVIPVVETVDYASQVNQLQAEVARLNAEKSLQAIQAQVGQWLQAGNITPAEKTGLAEFMLSLELSSNTFEFAQGQAVVKKSAKDWFVDFMNARKAVNLGASMGDDNPPATIDPAQISIKATEFMAEQRTKGIEISVPDAVSHVLSQSK